jgi:hypothetical protein
VGLLDHMVDLCLDFEEASKFFSRVVNNPFYPGGKKNLRKKPSKQGLVQGF